jgi:DNA-binding CsgD family transcriptional regulator
MILVDLSQAVSARRLVPQQPRQWRSREVEVLTWVAQGKTQCEIAAILGIAKQTVSEHSAAARKKLNAETIAHAVAIGIRKGLI